MDRRMLLGVKERVERARAARAAVRRVGAATLTPPAAAR
jgi:hypothetical protein